jgi:hypothetical protein
VDLSRWVKDLAAPPPAPSQPPAAIAGSVPAPAGAPQAPITLDSFHVELVSQSRSRDLVVSRLEPDRVNTSGVQRPAGLAIKVTTEPAGMELSVADDPEQRCASPCVFSLPKGKHSIQARADGYRTELRAVDVASAGETLHVAMEREFGVVALTSDRQDAAVLLDGKPVSSALPAKLKIPAGKYEIRTVQEGKTLTSREIDVRAGTTVELSFPK